MRVTSFIKELFVLLKYLAFLTAVLFAAGFALITLSSPANADTKRVRPDGHISFDASISGPTRLSVRDGRISKIIQADSQFEMVNDENTGDVFLRFSGVTPETESGHIITESGHTIGFTMRPSDRIDNQTIIIDLIGVQSAAAQQEAADAARADDTVAASGFAVSEGGATSFSGSLSRFVRAAIEAKIGRRHAGSHRSGRGTYTSGSYRATIRSVAAANARPQSYYSSKSLAVWVDDVATGGRRWVIIVEAK